MKFKAVVNEIHQWEGIETPPVEFQSVPDGNRQLIKHKWESKAFWVAYCTVRYNITILDWIKLIKISWSAKTKKATNKNWYKQEVYWNKRQLFFRRWDFSSSHFRIFLVAATILWSSVQTCVLPCLIHVLSGAIFTQERKKIVWKKMFRELFQGCWSFFYTRRLVFVILI